jgi:hypothetical protein
MDKAICGCPNDHEFIYHQADKCSLRLSVNNRIRISPPCPSCAAKDTRIKELEVCTRCNGGCPDKEHPVTERWCAECYEHLYKRPLELLQSRLAAKYAEIAGLRESVAREIERCNKAESEVDRLREAVECVHGTGAMEETLAVYERELRRRAKEGK